MRERDETAIREALVSAERYRKWQQAYDEGPGRPIDMAQGEVIILADEVNLLLAAGKDAVCRLSRAHDEADKYQARALDAEGALLAKGNEGVSERSAASSTNVHDSAVDEALNTSDTLKRIAPREVLEDFAPMFVLAHDVRRLREESRLFREAGHAAELRIVELREETARLREILDSANEEARAFQAGYKRERATLARVEALLELEHDDSTVRVSRLRELLRGEP
jgi:hypothetical protein